MRRDRRPRTGRRIAGTVAAAVLTTAMVVAAPVHAEDDPVPTDWPSVRPPEGGGDANDPAPTAWPEVKPPEAGGDASDPEPTDWPSPTPL